MPVLPSAHRPAAPRHNTPATRAAGTRAPGTRAAATRAAALVAATAVTAPLLALSVIGAPTAGAAAIRPIGPHQAFVGETLGQLGTDKILVICPGAARTGHPAANQSVEVLPAISSEKSGRTGSKAHQIDVTFPGPTASVIVVEAYRVAVPIPTSLTVPCGVTAQVAFNPAPTSKTAEADLVAVAFDPGPAL